MDGLAYTYKVKENPNSLREVHRAIRESFENGEITKEDITKTGSRLHVFMTRTQTKSDNQNLPKTNEQLLNMKFS